MLTMNCPKCNNNKIEKITINDYKCLKCNNIWCIYFKARKLNSSTDCGNCINYIKCFKGLYIIK